MLDARRAVGKEDGGDVLSPGCGCWEDTAWSCWPPATRSPPWSWGEISSYPPGFRENGSVFCAGSSVQVEAAL